jgi:hypothetical protein
MSGSPRPCPQHRCTGALCTGGSCTSSDCCGLNNLDGSAVARVAALERRIAAALVVCDYPSACGKISPWDVRRALTTILGSEL